MKTYRVSWTEEKTILVQAENEEEAQQLATDHFYDKAILEEWDVIEIQADAEPIDEETIWVFDDTYGEDKDAEV